LKTSNLSQTISAAGAGLLFGQGLIISRMIDPKKVMDFLDIAGDWDPSLAFVMIGAIAVTAIGYPRGRSLLIYSACLCLSKLTGG